MRFTYFCRRNKWFLTEIVGCTWQQRRYVKTTHHYGLIYGILACYSTSPELRHVSNGNKMYCSMLHLLSHWQCYTRRSSLLHLCIGVSLGLHARVIGASADYTLISYCYVIFRTIFITCYVTELRYVMRSQDDVMRSKGCGNLLIGLPFLLPPCLEIPISLALLESLEKIRWLLFVVPFSVKGTL